MDFTDFGWALDQLRAGKQVTRAGWNGPGQYLELQEPDMGSKMTLPYVFITTVRGDRVPWLASQTDLLASDWYVVGVSATGLSVSVVAPCRVCHACVGTEDMGRHLEWHRSMTNIPKAV